MSGTAAALKSLEARLKQGGHLHPGLEPGTWRIHPGLEGVYTEHCAGLIAVETDYTEKTAPAGSLEPWQHATPASMIYKAVRESGYNYGPCFQKHLLFEATMGKTESRSTVAMDPPRRCPESIQPDHLPHRRYHPGRDVLRDRPFDSMTLEEYHQAVACKIQGTWNLHTAAERLHLSLDFFTMLSSISGDDGFIANNAGFQEKHFDSRTFKGINNRLLRQILYFSLLQQAGRFAPDSTSGAAATQMVTGIVAPQPADSALLRDARFSALRAGAGAGKTPGESGGGSNSANAEVQALLLLLRSSSADTAFERVDSGDLNARFANSIRPSLLLLMDHPCKKMV
ncbi:KR-domain-containing protein [Aspergillus violaceofuscus CBS 115571]|uniref:KR-domain-containing protein n=1 Tax=Aspergillus violaceofuscus (strain CBS 115571) TaxID=1450538 RepID=A0A2V5GQH2_ASPV1|nr:KR-domain-containing protein [Aspergillus violaceofuscus CBS 115571]